MQESATRIATACCASLVVLAASGSVRAAAIRSWSASTAEQLADGTFDATALDGEGRVRLAPEHETLWGPAEGVVWAVAPAGADAFAGLSAPGRLLRIAGDGSGAAVWYEAEGENLVAAVAGDPRGGVWFALSPLGQVLRATAPGQVEVVAETGARFVWALAPGASGSLWIGTGVPGLLQRLGADGALETIFDSGDDPVRSLLPLPDGGVVVGTGGRGRVIRFDADGNPFVLYDADEPEIVDLAAGDDGAIFALAARGSKQTRAAAPQAAAPHVDETVRVVVTAPPGDEGEGEEEESESAEAPRQTVTAPRRPSMPGGAAVYRIAPDGTALALWNSAREMPFSLARERDGGLLVATGDLGRVWRLDDRGQAAMLLEIASDQASALAVAQDGAVWVGGTSDARLERIGRATRATGTYLSTPIDAGAPAEWGRLEWDADLPRGSRIEVSIRAGNTDEPDATWSTWVAVEPEGGRDPGAGPPPARWAQARVRLHASRAGETPAVGRIEVFFLPRNRAPRIESVEVLPSGVVWSQTQAPAARPRGPVVADDPVSRKVVRSLEGRTSSPVRKSFELGARTVHWSASDPDEDALTYSVEIRREGSATWLPLASGIEEAYYGWDARSFPDGVYRVRVTAGDAQDNPGGQEFVDRLVSPAFQVDNTRPSVSATRIHAQAEALEVEFTAADPGGRVAAVEFALDGEDWRPLDPQDGVADSADERYRLRLATDPAAPPPRSIRVRVTDSSGNLGGDAWALDAR